jgi:two-component system, LytTR family, response regulator
MSYKVVVVEDELQQQEAMAALLSSFPEFELIGMASNIEDGEILLKTLKPDLALLDVMVGSSTSFEMLNQFNQIPFSIIFTTSYDHFAVQAFRMSAIDYLMKPIARNEFEAALEKFKQQQTFAGKYSNVQNLLSNLRLPEADTNTRIALPTHDGFLFVSVKDVVRSESNGNYAVIHTLKKEKIMISRTMKEVEQIFSAFRFFRAHNSHLINLDFVQEYVKGTHVRMIDGSLIEVSRRRREVFMMLFKKV